MEKRLLEIAAGLFVVEGNTIHIEDIDVVVENNMLCVMRDNVVVLNSGLGFAVREQSVPSFLCRSIKAKAREINSLFAAARRL